MNRLHATFCNCAGCEDTGTSYNLPRRGFLGGLGAAIAAASMAGGIARAETSLSPAQAMDELLAGNKRFMDQKMTSLTEDLTILRRNTVAKQTPFAAVLSCADSRVPVEFVFDQNIGRLFVTRVAGNVASSEIVASLEYGVAVLGTRAILVLGHSNCGAVQAAMAGKAVPGQISLLYKAIRPAVNESNGNLETAIKANAKIQADLLATASPVLAGAVKDGTLEVHAGYYDLGSGQVTIL